MLNPPTAPENDVDEKEAIYVIGPLRLISAKMLVATHLNVTVKKRAVVVPVARVVTFLKFVPNVMMKEVVPEVVM